MRTGLIRFALVAGVVLTLGVFWWADWPLGIPGEWTWLRIPVEPGQSLEVVLGGLLAAVGAALYVAVAWVGARRIVQAPRGETAAWLAALVAAGFAWLFFAQEGPVEGYRMSKSAFVLYYESSSGYFTQARYEVEDVRSFLAGYEESIEGEVLHIGTHPPGLILAHRGLIALCRWSPALTDTLLATQPESVERAFSEINRYATLASPPKPLLLPSDRAAIWLAALLTQLAGVAAAVPLYLLAARTFSPAAAWMAAAFWPLVPSLAVFLPKSDALYPFLGLLFLWLWLEGWRRGSLVKSLSAGLVLWLGSLLSLALAPVVALAGFLTVWELRTVPADTPRSTEWGRLLVALACAAAAFLALVAVLWIAFDLNLPRVWTINYRNHAGFYDEYQRTWWKWLLVNPVESAFGVGLPAVVLAVAACGRVLFSTERWSRRAGPFWGCLVVWGLLWLSGKNSGEAARLWLVLFPWPIWLTAAIFEAPGSANDQPSPIRFWLFAVVLQAAACIATVLRVYGFPQ